MLTLTRSLIVCGIFVLLTSGCAKAPVRTARDLGEMTPVSNGEVKMANELATFRGLAHVVAERAGIKWANNVAVIVKMPSSVRLDAIERITDVVATVVATSEGGYLNLPLESKRFELPAGQVALPVIGELPISSEALAGLLVGRPKITGGAKVTQSFHTQKGSYFVTGPTEEIEVSAKDGMPLVYTKFSSPSKKGVLFEADFDDIVSIEGRKIPQHIVIRFEQPKLLMEIKYLDLQPESPVHDRLFGLGVKQE